MSLLKRNVSVVGFGNEFARSSSEFLAGDANNLARWRRGYAPDRDRGRQSRTPPTPPDKRVRIRRFEQLRCHESLGTPSASKYATGRAKFMGCMPLVAHQPSLLAATALASRALTPKLRNAS